DSDSDGVCDASDICPGFDDNIDTDGDGTPDGCDFCDAPTISAFTSTGPLCQGENALLETSVTGTAPFAFAWSGPGLGQTGSTADLTVLNASGGTYQVIVTNACGDDTATVNLVVQPLPDASFLYGATVYCQNSFDPSPSIATLGGTFSANSSDLAIDPVSGTIDLDASLPGPYIITYSVQNGNCAALHTEQIALALPPSAEWTSPGSMCDGNGPVDLNTFLNIGTTIGGTWSGTNITGSLFNPSGLAGVIEITYTATVGDCSSDGVGYITITAAPPANAGPDAEVCGNVHHMNATLQTAVGNWFALNGGTWSSQTDPNATVTVPAAGVYTFVWTVGDGGCYSSDTVLVTFRDPAMVITVDAGPDQMLEVTDHTFLDGTTNGTQWLWSLAGGSGNISDTNDPGTEVYLLGVGANTFVLSASNGPCPSTMDTVTITVNELSIPTGFSPNDDGTNDALVIPGITAYPGNSIVVFDRWGRKVYEMKGYVNDWEGKYLPNDTYFMVLNITESRSYNGYLIIKR
ncbi:MAG: gliding motility-associated C-terminal domain-containing protein, partial [Flavobacteriales bacterium]